MASSVINSDDGVISGTSGLKSSGGDDGVLVFQSKGTETARINTDKQIVAAAGTASLPALTTTGDVNTGIFFPAADTIAFAEGGAEAMRIDSSGNVGIGTSSPSTLLNIQKADVSGFSANTTFDVMVIENGTSNTGAVLQIVAATNGSSEIGFSDSTRNQGLISYSHTSDAMIFRTNNAERARINSDGRVLVGKTSSTNSTNGVELSGSTNFFTNTDNYAALFNRKNTNGEVVFFQKDEVNVGNVNVTTTATTYNTSSDYRLKENIAPMTDALATVAQLKPCIYTWKVDGSAGQGFIAHELQEVVPDCVTGEKDAIETYTDEEGVEQTRPVYQGIDTSFLVATLTAAIQELKAELDEAKARIATLEQA
jgi:hypothetical protein